MPVKDKEEKEKNRQENPLEYNASVITIKGDKERRRIFQISHLSTVLSFGQIDRKSSNPRFSLKKPHIPPAWTQMVAPYLSHWYMASSRGTVVNSEGQ